MPTYESKNPIEELAEFICKGLSAPNGEAKRLLASLFGTGGRYYEKHCEPSVIRAAYGLAGVDGDEGIPFAGLINAENPPSGLYGGTSVVWFPTQEAGSIISLCVGKKGLPPDEGILTRPGHRRRIAALRRYLSRMGVNVWTKTDPSAIVTGIPKVVINLFAGFEQPLNKYSCEMYCIAKVPAQRDLALKVVQSFFDLYAYERSWNVLKHYQAEFATFIALKRE